MSADERRIYTDEEFAVILRKVAETSSRTDQPGLSPEGLTLADMKSAAAQAGFDPALVEREARMLTMRSTASTFERLIGGPLRHEHVARFRVRLTEEAAARVLSAVRLNPHYYSSNAGHSSAVGLAWTASGGGNVLGVIARPDADATSVSVAIDRRGTFVLTGFLSALGVFGALAFATGVGGGEPALAPWAALAGISGVFATARSFWKSSTRKAHERIREIVDVVGQTLAPDEPERTGGSVSPNIPPLP